MKIRFRSLCENESACSRGLYVRVQPCADLKSAATNRGTINREALKFSVLLMVISLTRVHGVGWAQFWKPPKEPATPPEITQKVGIDQKPGIQVPLDLTFRDETSKSVPLREFFGDKPVLLTPVYYECPAVCNVTLNGVVTAMRMIPLKLGVDFEIITFSFNPKETPTLAAKKKESYLKSYLRGEKGASAEKAAAGWHFLTGDEASIKKLTDAIGFRYTYDARSGQYAHAAGIMVLTPAGVVSHYFYGSKFWPQDVRLALVEASQGKIGSLADKLLLLCYQYDPTTSRYGLLTFRLIQGGGILTLLALGTFMFLNFRRDIRQRAAGSGQQINPKPEKRQTKNEKRQTGGDA